MMQFDLYSQYYDLIYQTKAYNEESVLVLSKLGIEFPSILELGSGSGGHAKVMSNYCSKITGIDISEKMVQIANSKKIPNFKSTVANMTSFELFENFDAAISLFHVFSYLTSTDDIISCLQSVNNHLNRGAPFIFDFWYSPAVYHLGFENRTKTFWNNNIIVERKSSAILNHINNTAKINFAINVNNLKTSENETFEENHSMRFFSIPEIELFAKLTGFKLVECFDLNSQQPSIESWAITAKLIKI